MGWATASRAMAALVGAACCLVAVAYAAPRPASPDPGGRGEASGPPPPRIVKRPMNPSLSASAAFAYTSRLAEATFLCRLDSGPWRRCGGRVAYRGLGPGRHVFSVRVESRAGTRGRPARFEWVRAEPKRFAIEPKGIPGELFPGAPPVSLPLVLRNPNPAPILVTSLRVAVTASPPGCDSAANLLTVPSSASPTTPLRIPASGAVEVPTAKVSAPALAMRDLPVNQDACRGARFPLAFSGGGARVKRRSRTRLVGAALVAAAITALASTAFAYFTGQGTGSAAAAVSKLTAPAITTANPAAGGTVSLAWSAATAPGVEAVKYYVTRDGGEAGGTCPTQANTNAVTSCVDSGLAVGTHTYTVTAVWRSWSAISGTSTAKITVGVATHFTIAVATTTPAVGASDNLTITAKDDNESTVTTYTGSKSLTFSGAASSPGGTAPTVVNSSGTATAFGKATTLTFTAGVASVSSSRNGVMKIFRAGPASIVASDGTIEADPPLQVNVVSGAPTKYTLAAATATPVAGRANDLTISAVDTYGNAAASYDGTKSLTFSGASESPAKNVATVTDASGAEVPFGTATAIDFEEGVATPEGVANGEMTLYKSGSTSVKATDGALTNSTALAVTVAAAEASKLVLTGSSATPSATGTSNLTTTAQDPYANTATGYTGARNIYFSGALPSPAGTAPTIVNTSGTAVSFGAATELNFKSGVASVSSSKNGLMRLTLAGETSISASDGTIGTAAPLLLNVLIGTATRWGLVEVASSAGTIGSPCLFTCPVTALGNKGTITAKAAVTDASGNTVSNVGTSRVAKVTATGGTIAGTPLAIASTGPAVSATTFTYTAPASGNFTNTITLATSSGTSYTSATATASR